MKTRSDVEALEKLIGQLQGLHAEISLLAKKAPNDGVNAFKLRLINNVISLANSVLAPNYLPFDGFTAFDADDVPSTSDVALVLAQYMEEAERYRSDNVIISDYKWYYVVDGSASEIPSGPPSKIGKK